MYFYRKQEEGGVDIVYKVRIDEVCFMLFRTCDGKKKEYPQWRESRSYNTESIKKAIEDGVLKEFSESELVLLMLMD